MIPKRYESRYELITCLRLPAGQPMTPKRSYWAALSVALEYAREFDRYGMFYVLLIDTITDKKIDFKI